MTDSPTNHRNFLQAAVIGLWLVTLAVNAPGHLSYDSIVQMVEGQTGIYAGAHPPVMSALLGLAWRILPGGALYLLAVSALFYLSLAALVGPGPRGRMPNRVAAGVLLAALASPLVLITQGTIWKDVLFANFSVACFTCLALAPQTTRRRTAALALAALLAALAAATRQNGIVVPIVAALAVGQAALGQGHRPRAALGQAGSFLCATLLVFFAVQQTVKATATRYDGAGVAWAIQSLQRYDIAGMIAHGAPIPASAGLTAAQAQTAANLITQTYSASRIESLKALPEAQASLDAVWTANPQAVWLHMLRSDPWAWASHRFDVLRWMLFPPDQRQCLPVWVGIAGPAEGIAQLGLQSGAHPQDQALYRYAVLLFDTPLFLNGAWAILAVILLVVLARRRSARQGDRAMAALLGAALAVAASFAMIGIACDLRYMFLLPCACCAALAQLSRSTA